MVTLAVENIGLKINEINSDEKKIVIEMKFLSKLISLVQNYINA